MIRRGTWIEILRDFYEFEIPELIQRDIKIEIDIPIKRVISIIGPRRAGKTYFIFQTIKKLLEKGIPKERLFYVNLEDDRLLGVEIEDLRNMLNIFYEMYPENKQKKVWVFLDEIQNVPNWEKFVRSILDKENVQIFVTGSSSKLLAREIATVLRGRCLPYNVFPFSFREFLKAKKFIYKDYFSSREKSKLLNLLDNYIKFGGYPEVVVYPKERKKMLKEILEVTIYRDIVERYKVKNMKILRLLLKQLIFSTLFSVHKFYNFLKSQGIKIGKNTLYNYLEYFSDSLVVFPLRKFSYSYKQLQQSLPKIYFVDNGLLSAGGIESVSKLMENAVFVELLKKGYIANVNIFYYLSQVGEVDFVIKNGKVKKLIQVCYDVEDYSTKERELKALVRASRDLRCNNLVVLTWDYEGLKKYKGKKIKFLPLWKWILTNTPA